MLKSLSLTTTATALLLSSALWAQEATTETPAEGDATEATEATETEGTTDSAFDLGQEVQEEPTYITEEYGDWQMRCFRIAEGEDPCQMFQLLKDDQGNPVAEFTMFKLKDGGPAVAGATVTAPLFTLLTAEVKISVDGGPAKSYPFRFCSQAGCVAQIGMTQAEVDAFKRGVKASVVIVPAQAPDQKVAIATSLKGFTAAYDNVSEIAN